MTVRQHCLAVCAPGLEDLCATELAALGVHIRRAFRGGVEFSASEREIYAANVWLRTATRVVVRVAQFEASGFAEFEHHAREVEWERWVPAGASPQVRASTTSSRLYHTGAIEERLAELAGSGPAEGPLLIARLIHDRVTLSIDSSGPPLYQRGWRQATAKAPVRETLAAALVLASGWDRRTPFMDPMCGSGTIVVEAALLAAGLPPGAGRSFAFQEWPSFAPGTWASVWASAGAATNQVADMPPIVGSDRDAGAVRAALGNAARAGVGDLVEIREAPVSAVEAPDGRGSMITNPPYGKRIGGADLRDLYASLGNTIRDRLPGWSAGLLVADGGLAAQTKLALSERLRTDNGGIPVRFLVTGSGAP